MALVNELVYQKIILTQNIDKFKVKKNGGNLVIISIEPMFMDYY